MKNRQNNSLKSTQIDLKIFFTKPISQRQKQYEVVRAFTMEGLSAKDIAEKYGYTINTVYTLIKNAKIGKLQLFPEVEKGGPRKRRTDDSICEKIIEYRKLNLSTPDIEEKLLTKEIEVSSRTIERIVKEAGFVKLKRRTNKELGITKENKLIPERSENLDLSILKPFITDCPVAGLFFFIPYIVESGIPDIVRKCQLPESSVIGSLQACLSMLALKLIGNERLSHMEAYDHETGLGVFAALNVLPKSTYMKTYSCLTSEEMLYTFQEKIMNQFYKSYPSFYQSEFINLDFHSIAHFGEESEMEKIWCGAKGKTLKGANTVFAQDSQSNAILYSRADILRKEEAHEIKKFITYWKKIKGGVKETLVFDCKFTKYKILDEIAQEGIKFITLRKRYEKLIKDALNIEKKQWNKIYLSIPKRKFKNVSVYEQKVILKGCTLPFRQIIMKDHGRELPTFILTNNEDLSITQIVEVYARRWRIENKLAELVAFFNLNALSSDLMIRIHFDILWTMIADTLYQRLAQDLRRFEKKRAPTIFKKFINMPGKVIYDGNKFQIKIRKRAFTPILKGVEKLQNSFKVPWLNNLPMEIIWTP